MEKISGIIPSSQRVSSVDLKNSQPIRPGAPTFGRPQGASTPRGKRVTTAEAAVNQHRNLMDSREHKQAKIVTDLADQFFLLKSKEAPKDPIEDFDINYNLDRQVTGTPVDSGVDFDVPSGPRLEASKEPVSTEPAPSSETVEKEFVPRGSYLDVSA